MTCKELQAEMLDLVTGTPLSPGAEAHLRTCQKCTAELAEMRQTMAMLDQWEAPADTSPYFMTRLHARMREQDTQPAPSVWAWLRRPALALSMAVLMVLGISLFYGGSTPAPVIPTPQAPQVGTAVGDLQFLDKNHDLLSSADLLDDLTDDNAPQDDGGMQQ